MAGIIVQHEKEVFSIDVGSFMLQMLYNFNSLLYFPPVQGLNPEMSGLQATLSLYEREVGPMPKKVSARKHDS